MIARDDRGVRDRQAERVAHHLAQRIGEDAVVLGLLHLGRPRQDPRTPERAPARRLLFFPGSTLGNFADEDAVALLRAMRQTMGRDGLALVGIDLHKDPGPTTIAVDGESLTA